MQAMRRKPLHPERPRLDAIVLLKIATPSTKEAPETSPSSE